MHPMLEREIFKTIVRHTPLVSIDLVVEGPDGRILLGKRTNRPAQGWWFVPGGRVNKDERIARAFERLTEGELGLRLTESAGEFLGVYEHLYDDNFSGPDFSTHYVVLAYRLRLKETPADLPTDQHSAYRWFDQEALLTHDRVHENSKAYFRSTAWKA